MRSFRTKRDVYDDARMIRDELRWKGEKEKGGWGVIFTDPSRFDFYILRHLGFLVSVFIYIFDLGFGEGRREDGRASEKKKGSWGKRVLHRRERNKVRIVVRSHSRGKKEEKRRT